MSIIEIVFITTEFNFHNYNFFFVQESVPNAGGGDEEMERPRRRGMIYVEEDVREKGR